MITKDDLINYRAFLRVMEEGKFEIQGRATIKVALLFKWYIDLEPKLINGVPKEKTKSNIPKIKSLKPGSM